MSENYGPLLFRCSNAFYQTVSAITKETRKSRRKEGTRNANGLLVHLRFPFKGRKFGDLTLMYLA